MDTPQQLPRRKAAIKATTQLADLSSSEEDNDADDEYGAKLKQTTRRVKGAESTEKTKEKNTHSKKGSAVGLLDAGTTVGSENKRKRAASTLTSGRPQKRQRGNTRSRNVGTAGGVGGGGRNAESDLTPLSSGTEREEIKSFTRPIAEFPLKLTPPPSSPSHPNMNHTKLQAALPPGNLDLGDDSDELPDVGSVLSQQDVSHSKGTSYERHKVVSTPKHYLNTLARRKTCNDTLSSRASSPTPPPPSLPPLSRRSLTYDGTSTEPNTSDHYDLQVLSDDSDLELDSVGDGELCLARAKAMGTVYWPAKILEVKKSTGGRGKQKKIFRVMFLDKKEKDIPRNWFYTPSQEEFCNCSIGQFESSHVDVVNDIDEDSRQTDILHPPPPLSRSPSPIGTPSLPPLSGPAYCNLALRQQFTYVTPILKAIMNEECPWGLRRHELYMKGGTSRQKLLNEGGMRGAVDARSVDELLVLVEYWCLGGRGRDFVGDDSEENQAAGCRPPVTPLDGINRTNDVVEAPEPVLEVGAQTTQETSKQESEVQNTVPAAAPDEAVIDLPLGTDEPTTAKPQDPEAQSTPEQEQVLTAEPKDPSPPPSTQQDSQPEVQPPKRKCPRQRGSPAYEKLSPLDKVQYCIEVLLPETIGQILLWRTGERKSIDVMWENQQEEERLHERGEQLMRETDWVMDLMRLRRALEKRKGTKGTKKKGKPESGKRSQGGDARKTRSGRLGGVVGSYKE